MTDDRKPSKIIRVFPRHGGMSVCVRIGGRAIWRRPQVWIDLEHMAGYFTVPSACDLLGRIAQAVAYAQEIESLVRVEKWAFYDAVPELPRDKLTEFPGTHCKFGETDPPQLPLGDVD